MDLDPTATKPVPPNNPPTYTDDPDNTAQVVPVGVKPQPLDATDPDKDTLTHTQIGGLLPPGVTLSPDGTFGGAPGQPGTYKITVRVCDPTGACDDTDLTLVVPVDVEVAGPPDPPGRTPEANEPEVQGTTEEQAPEAATPGALPTTGAAIGGLVGLALGALGLGRLFSRAGQGRRSGGDRQEP